jgi:hypothetical protein
MSCCTDTAFTTSIKQKVNDYDFRTYATNERSIINDITIHLIFCELVALDRMLQRWKDGIFLGISA